MNLDEKLIQRIVADIKTRGTIDRALIEDRMSTGTSGVAVYQAGSGFQYFTLYSQIGYVCTEDDVDPDDTDGTFIGILTGSLEEPELTGVSITGAAETLRAPIRLVTAGIPQLYVRLNPYTGSASVADTFSAKEDLAFPVPAIFPTAAYDYLLLQLQPFLARLLASMPYVSTQGDYTGYYDVTSDKSQAIASLIGTTIHSWSKSQEEHIRVIDMASWIQGTAVRNLLPVGAGAIDFDLLQEEILEQIAASSVDPLTDPIVVLGSAASALAKRVATASVMGEPFIPDVALRFLEEYRS